MPAPPLCDRFVGCLLGHALGDAIGAPFEGLDARAIYDDVGYVRPLVPDPPFDALVYTDDTQMSIGVAETLVALGGIDEQYLAEQFARNYEPNRGYGPGARRILDVIVSGGDRWRAADTVFPGGSLGNGAAMRVAPIGLMFHRNRARLRAEAAGSARVTQVHPVGVDGAVVYATAVAVALAGSGRPLDPAAFFMDLFVFAETVEFQSQLETATRLSPDDPIDFGTSLEAHRSVVTALACFAFAPDDFAAAVGRAIGFGGDTDTIAAMAGGLVGARLGTAALPPKALAKLEDGPKGRAYIEGLALTLCDASER